MLEKLFQKRTEILVLAALGIICFLVHARWITSTGIGGEQYWIIQNLHKSFFGGFFYTDDQSRILMSLVFHLVYIFFGTSYQAILIVNILLTFLISVLVYSIMKALSFPTFYGAIAGLLVVLSGGDTSTRLFSMLVVKQIVVCALVLIFISLLIIRQVKISVLQKIVVITASLIGSYTYEVFLGFLFALLAYLFVFYRNEQINQFIFYAFIPGALALYQIVSRYIFENRTSYQSQKFLIPDGYRVFESAQTYLQGGLAPWTWSRNGLRQVFVECQSLINNTIGGFPLVLSIALSLIVIFALTFRLSSQKINENLTNEHRSIFLFVSLIVAAYAPYFFVTDGNSNWRTQLLGQPLVIILIMFVLRFLINKNKLLQYTAAICFAIYFFIWSLFGVTSLQTDNLYLAKYWADHSVFFNSLVKSVPGFSANTQILVVNVPVGYKYCPGVSRDPFEDEYWFQAALHSYYPETYDPKNSKLVGTYSHKTLNETFADVSKVNGQTVLKIDNEQGFIPVSNLLLLEFKDGVPNVVNSLIDRNGLAVLDYRPQALITKSLMSSRNSNLDIPILEILR